MEAKKPLEKKMELSSDLGKRIDDGEAERELQEDGGKTCALGLFLQLTANIREPYPAWIII